MSDDVVKKYIERVEKLRQKNQSKVTREDLESIAREVGLSDDDLAAVDEHVQAHYDRGNGYVDHGLWDDAIAEFEEAFALAPTRVHVVYALANAHYGKAQAAESEADRQRALELAKECLELDSQYQPAFTLQSQLRSLEIGSAPTHATGGSAETRQSRANLFLVAIMVSLMVSAGVIGGIVFTTGDEPGPTSATVESHAPAVKTPLVEPPEKEAQTPSTSDEAPFRLGESTGKTVEVVESPQGAGLVLHVSKSEHNVYDDKAYYAIHALVKNESGREFEEIKAEFALVDTAGTPLKTHMAELHGSHEATLRPGDWTPYSTTISAPREFDRIRVKIVSTDAKQALDYAKEEVVEPTYASKVPDNVKLEIRERSSGVSSADYFQAEWAFENVGTGYIKDLKVESIVFGVGGEELGRRDWLVVYSGTPPMKPGQVWPESTIQKVDEPVDRYELRILQIE